MSISGVTGLCTPRENMGSLFPVIVALLLVTACGNTPPLTGTALLIHDAARANNLIKVQELVEADPSLLKVKDPPGNSPLHWAAYLSHMDTVHYLIESGANVNARNWAKETPLHAAAQSSYGDAEIVEFLLGNGANIDARDRAGRTPLVRAASSGLTTVAELLLTEGADPEGGGAGLESAELRCKARRR